MASLFFLFFFFIAFYCPFILATENKVVSLNPAISKRDTARFGDCAMTNKKRGSNCNPNACYGDGGRCELDIAGRCYQYLWLKGSEGQWVKQSLSKTVWPESCMKCRCTRAWLGSGECAIKSTQTCDADECFRVGGRCELKSAASARGSDPGCYSHVLDPAGILVMQRWTTPHSLPECKGCRCQQISKKSSRNNKRKKQTEKDAVDGRKEAKVGKTLVMGPRPPDNLGLGMPSPWPPMIEGSNSSPDIVIDTPSSSPPVSEGGL